MKHAIFTRDCVSKGRYYKASFKRHLKDCSLNEDTKYIYHLCGLALKQNTTGLFLCSLKVNWNEDITLFSLRRWAYFASPNLRSVIATIIQPNRVLRVKRTASKHFGGVSWTTLLCFCNLQSIWDMPGLESLRHIGLSRFYDEYSLNTIVRTSITLRMRLQFSEMEGRKWGYYEDEGDLLLFFSATETHAGFKEELQCMSSWILFTLEEGISLKGIFKIYFKVIFKGFRICLITRVNCFFCLLFLHFFPMFSSWCYVF